MGDHFMRITVSFAIIAMLGIGDQAYAAKEGTKKAVFCFGDGQFEHSARASPAAQDIAEFKEYLGEALLRMSRMYAIEEAPEVAFPEDMESNGMAYVEDGRSIIGINISTMWGLPRGIPSFFGWDSKSRLSKKDLVNHQAGYLAYYTILAHELGHLANGHWIARFTGGKEYGKRLGSRGVRQRELVADKFAGHTLAMLGVGRDVMLQAEARLRPFWGEEGDPRHAPLRERAEAIFAGWESVTKIHVRTGRAIEMGENLADERGVGSLESLESKK
jgi:hypothetical protein